MNYIQKLLNAAKRVDDMSIMSAQLARHVEENVAFDAALDKVDHRSILERNIDTTQNVVTNLENKIGAHELEIDRLYREHREMVVSRDGLLKALRHMRDNDLCKDEGCPQAGVDHVCVTRDPDYEFATKEAPKYDKMPAPDDGQVTVPVNPTPEPAPVIKTKHTNIRGSKEEATIAAEKAAAEKIVNKVVKRATRRGR